MSSRTGATECSERLSALLASFWFSSSAVAISSPSPSPPSCIDFSNSSLAMTTMDSRLSPNIIDVIARLSSKPGVTATLVMDRKSSSIISSQGSFQGFCVSDAARPTAQFPTPSETASVSATNARVSSPTTDGGFLNASSTTTILNGSGSGPEENIVEFAKKIWHYVDSTALLVQDMDGEDDLKLLRVRTKKHEFVIVPDAKFIFVAVHNVPS